MRQPVALFVAERSVYHELAGECYDARRDALKYFGPHPVVAHPPCRTWGRLRHLSKAPLAESLCGIHAVNCVRAFGGVMEHPSYSRLWAAAGCALPGQRDAYNGWTLPVHQSWWGHRAPKSTWLYIVGIEPSEVPVMPFELGEPPGRIELMGKAERNGTPRAFAQWLLDLAARTVPQFAA